MANLIRIVPNIQIPGLLVPQVQYVPYKEYYGYIGNYGALGIDEAYVTTVTQINSETFVGQQWGENLANQSYALGQLSMPYYIVEAYIKYNVLEQDKFSRVVNTVALPDFLEKLAEQGINQRLHFATLWGFDTDNTLSQGIMSNATEITMPADSAGNQKLTSYKIPELQNILSKQIREVMDATYGMIKPALIASSARVINYLQTAIVPLLDYQKTGAGSESVAGVFSKIAEEWLGVGEIQWIKDNRLQGVDTKNKDYILIIAKGMENMNSYNEDSQNLVGEFNTITYNTFGDKGAGLMRFDAPPSLGVMQRKYIIKVTPGITLRSEAVCKMKVEY